MAKTYRKKINTDEDSVEPSLEDKKIFIKQLFDDINDATKFLDDKDVSAVLIMSLALINNRKPPIKAKDLS